MAKLRPEQGSKQPIPPSLDQNKLIPQTFWVPTYRNTPFGFWACNRKIDNKPQNVRKTYFPEAFIHETAVYQLVRFLLYSDV